MDLASIRSQAAALLEEVRQLADLRPGHLLVIGCSTSEVLGKHIGKAGSREVAAVLYEVIAEAQQTYGFHPAFQCCEHLNRALVVERGVMEKYGLEEVTVVPVPEAGGSMAAYAFLHMQDPVVVEELQAHAGIDIGDTFIGMHLKRVAVPIRPSVRQIGEAHVTAARTRPKLIGGARAVYEANRDNQSCT